MEVFASKEIRNSMEFLEQFLTQLTNTLGKIDISLLIVFITIPFVLVAEKIFPAKPEQRIVNPSLVQDSLWFITSKVFRIMVLIPYVVFLEALYTTHLSFMSVQWLDELPDIMRLLWGVLLIDFLSWFHHWVRHKVTWFWQFHAIHHSQRHLNLFTDFRIHVFEFIIATTIQIIPLLSLRVQAPYIVQVMLFGVFFSLTYHANIKTNLGPLRYVLVTPQSHRIHHSIEPHHQDKNFGVLLSIWDRMFGTQYTGYEEYPNTGVDHKDFPEDQPKYGLNMFVFPILQHIYRFQKIIRRA